MKTVGALILAACTFQPAPVHANAFGTLASSVILQRALELTFTMRPELSAISLDLSDRRCKLNQSIISRIHTIPAVQDFPGTTEDAADIDVPVVLNQCKEVRRTITAVQIAATERNLIDEAAMPFAQAISNYIVDQVATNWTIANFTVGGTAYKTVVASGSEDFATITGMRKTLNQRGVPMGQRFGVVNSTVYANLLEDPQVARFEKVIIDNDEDPVQTGTIGRVAGFNNIFEYPSMSSTGNMSGFWGSKDSVVIASGLLTDPREVLANAPFPGNIDVITDPATGFSVMAVEYIDPTNLSANIYMCWLMGTALGNPNNGQLQVTA